MKRLVAAALTIFIILAGCAQAGAPATTAPAPVQPTPTQAMPEEQTETAPEDRNLSIVTAIFPQYDWVREILGDHAERFDLTLLLDILVDLHSYQPSISDIALISASDLFIHVGGHSDGWVDDVLRQATNPNMVVLNLLEVLGDAVLMEIEIEGAEHICDDDCDDDHDHGGVHLGEDEHVWLSLRHAKTICAAITDALAELDPDNAEAFRRNLDAYVERLSALDMEFQAVADAASVRTLVFADRFPFRYLMEDYGIRFYAAFSGCHAAAEASFSTIVFLATRMEELGLGNIMISETADGSIARTVISSTPGGGQQILVLNAMQAVLRRDIDEGLTYLSVMESNLDVLREALS